MALLITILSVFQSWVVNSQYHFRTKVSKKKMEIKKVRIKLIGFFSRVLGDDMRR